MTADAIRLAFHKAGYKVVSTMQVPHYVIVTPRSGFSRKFPSYAAAYNFYFNKRRV